jgi:predicted DNA binding protein
MSNGATVRCVSWGEITAEVACEGGRRHDPIMGRDRAHQATADLFSTASLGDWSLSATKQVTSAPQQRHVLPKDLPNSLKHLTDRELDLLITAVVEEAKRRGRPPSIGQADESVPKRSSRTDHRRQLEPGTVSLTRGQINAVRAAFKAGIKPSLIARQFGISQSDVRKVLASDTTHR